MWLNGEWREGKRDAQGCVVAFGARRNCPLVRRVGRIDPNGGLDDSAQISGPLLPFKLDLEAVSSRATPAAGAREGW
jgi:hypothetical protein